MREEALVYTTTLQNLVFYLKILLEIFDLMSICAFLYKVLNYTHNVR